MAQLRFVALLLFARPAAAAPPSLVPPLGHLSVSSFYGFDPASQHSWMNLNYYGPNGDTVQAQLDAWDKYGTPSLFGNLPLFNRSNGGSLYPGWEQEVEGIVSELRPNFGPGRAFRGIFLGDEICCRNTECYAASLAPAAAKLRELLGKDAILATNECALDPPKGGYPDIPADFDLWSVDTYNGFFPGSRGADEVAQAKRDYERGVFPFLKPHQKAMLVPGMFGCLNESRAGVDHAWIEASLLEKLDGYWDWARSDTRVAGFVPWHYSSRGHDQAPGSPCDMMLGATNFTRAMARLRKNGAAIVSGAVEPINI